MSEPNVMAIHQIVVEIFHNQTCQPHGGATQKVKDHRVRLNGSVKFEWTET